MSAGGTGSDLDDLLRDLRASRREIGADVAKVVEHGAVNIKAGWRRRWDSIAHAPRLDEAVTYDLTDGGMTAVIGPDKHRPQGPLGNIIEFGTVNNSPIPGGAPALRDEAPRFTREVLDAVARRLTR